MTENKINSPLIISGAAVIVGGISIAYSKNRIDPLEKNVEELGEDVTSLALAISKMNNDLMQELSRVKSKYKSLIKKTERMSKKMDELTEELKDIRSSSQITPHERNEKNEVFNSQKKEKKKKESSESESEDLNSILMEISKNRKK